MSRTITVHCTLGSAPIVCRETSGTDAIAIVSPMPFSVTDEAIGSFNECCQKISHEHVVLALLNTLIDEIGIKLAKFSESQNLQNQNSIKLIISSQYNVVPNFQTIY